jgi:hypothetical protein
MICILVATVTFNFWQVLKTQNPTDQYQLPSQIFCKYILLYEYLQGITFAKFISSITYQHLQTCHSDTVRVFKGKIPPHDNQHQQNTGVSWCAT